MISESTFRTLASAPAGAAGGSLLGALGGLLEPLDYPRQAAWWLGNRAADAFGDTQEADYTPESIAGEGVGSFLLSALTDPLTYVGGGLGGVAGRGAGRQIARADMLKDELRAMAPGYEALQRLAPELDEGAAYAAKLADDHAGRVAQAQSQHAADVERVLQQNTVSLGGQTYPVEDAAAMLADPNSPLVQAIMGGKMPGVFAPRLGKKMSPVAEAMEQYGYAHKLPGGQTAVAYEGLSPVLRRRGSSINVEGYPIERLAEMDPGPFHRIQNPLPLPEYTPPPDFTPPTVRDILMSNPQAMEPGSGRAMGAGLDALGADLPVPLSNRRIAPMRVRGKWIEDDPMLNNDTVMRTLDAPVSEIAPMAADKLAQMRAQAGAIQDEAGNLPLVGRLFARNYLGL